MSSSEHSDLLASFDRLPALLEGDPDLIRRGAFFNSHLQVGIGGTPFDIVIREGRIVSFERGPFLMRSWCFAVRGTAEAWKEFWKPTPAPGWHDLFALSKQGLVTFEGDLHPFMAHLQYIKDLLSLPRKTGEAA